MSDALSKSNDQKPMADSESKKPEIKWYDKRLLIPCFIAAPLLAVLFYSMAMRHKPPEGFVFSREPVISGKYKCCSAGGKTTASWVGDTLVRCKSFSYFIFLGSNQNDCGLTQLNGHPVEVTRVVLPSSSDTNEIVVRITAYGKIYYDVNDQKIREFWISESTLDAISLPISVVAILHFILFVYFNYFHKFAPRKGDR